MRVIPGLTDVRIAQLFDYRSCIDFGICARRRGCDGRRDQPVKALLFLMEKGNVSLERLDPSAFICHRNRLNRDVLAVLPASLP